MPKVRIPDTLRRTCGSGGAVGGLGAMAGVGLNKGKGAVRESRDSATEVAVELLNGSRLRKAKFAGGTPRGRVGARPAA